MSLQVRQWPGNSSDLVFESVIRNSQALILSAAHLQSVADLPNQLIFEQKASILTQEAACMCAFFRVWW